MGVKPITSTARKKTRKAVLTWVFSKVFFIR